MHNPFLRRATELLRDPEAFLAVVSPEPVKYFLGKAGLNGQLYDSLVIITGTPGSGKTTLGRLFEFPTLSALLRNTNVDAYRTLVVNLRECGAIEGQIPAVLGCRLPLETDYRDFWEFPYPDELKLGLMMALIQARAVLSWIRSLTSSGVELSDIRIIPRDDADAATDAVGGADGPSVVERARAVELSLYKIIASLVAPPISQLDPASTDAYRPFDVIESFEVTRRADGETRSTKLRPLVVLDDAHTLHPLQFRGLKHWLARREFRVGRWILTRLDILSTREALASVTEEQTHHDTLPGITASRETTEIMLQSISTDRREQRLAFRKMARDMANRYLQQMPLFQSRGLGSFPDLLSNEPQPLTSSKLKDIVTSVDSAQGVLSISDSRRAALLQEVDNYRPGKRNLPEDVRLTMLNILMHRYAKRTPQRTFFDSELGPEPARPVAADVSVYDAARMHLLHRYDRAYYFGIDDLCDASSENAEQFLRLASTLVDISASQLIRSKPASINAVMQNKLLRRKAAEILEAWDFPQCDLVRRLISGIAGRCIAVSLEPNGWLGAGANAYGVPQREFDELSDKYPDLAGVIQFGIAYNAFSVVPHYPCKDEKWCLLELGGTVILHFGLTLKRGGFLQGGAAELSRILQEPQQ